MSDDVPSQRLLLIDDEAAIRTSFDLAFGDEGWSVTTAKSGEEAMDTFAAGKFDLVITDKNLPMMSGVDLVSQIREIDQEVTIMMLTGYGSKESAIDTLNSGIDAYVQKPVRDVFRLTARAKTIMKRRRRRRALEPQVSKPALDGFPALILCTDNAKADLISTTLKHICDSSVIVSDLAAAQSQLALKPASIIFVDDSVPGFAEAIAVLKGEHEPRPVAVFGQALGLETIMKLIDLGVSGFIAQPIGTEACTARVAEIVSNVRQR